ncbi:hypothetical protein QJ48_09420 [Paenibacillus sp. A3]|uniref:hypothetical protein n=1 Tax=Paenibacillus sp. A3 TaxID=1337054 RepID=UPI0006D53C19|nr:hypothetical protein [Paenibacillus sp. A3]KPV59708.1 hypothetical protein QJ48_09420 [Paenibacillus sp. A3]
MLPDQGTLESGLTMIAMCKQETGDIWHAHFGAAAIAGYFFAKENGLSDLALRSLTDQSEAMIKKHLRTPAILKANGCTVRQAESAILEALEPTIDRLHWVGHNAIYAAVSLLALHELGGWGSEENIDGICELLRAFENTVPGRSWLGFTASEVRRLGPDEADRFPKVKDARQLSEFILNEVAQFKTIYRAEAHHDLIGHMLTFSHALNILSDLGHESLFRRGLLPLFTLIKVLRRSHHLLPGDAIRLDSPVDRLPLKKAERAAALPTEPAYWAADLGRYDWDFGHSFKFAFSFYNHLNRSPQDKEGAVENFRYLVHG